MHVEIRWQRQVPDGRRIRADLAAENDRLRAAEQDAERCAELLDESLPWIKAGYGASFEDAAECNDLRKRVRAAIDAATAQPTCDGCGKPVRPLLCGHCAPASEPQAEPQPEAIPIAPVEVVRQALKELLESISECRMDQVTARFAKASVMARAVVDRYKDAT